MSSFCPLPQATTKAQTKSFWQKAENRPAQTISYKKTAEAVKMTFNDVNNDVSALGSFYEWKPCMDDSNNYVLNSNFQTSNNWKFIEVKAPRACNFLWPNIAMRLLSEASEPHRLSWEKQDDVSLLNVMSPNNQPAFAACNGGLKTTKNLMANVGDMEQKNAAAAMAVMANPINKDKNGIVDPSWKDDDPKPASVRIKVLPDKIGMSSTDNNIGELLAANMTLESLPTNMSTMTIADSEIVRNNFKAIRDETCGTPRNLIRKTQGGMSRSMTVWLSREIDRHLEADVNDNANNNNTTTQSNEQENRSEIDQTNDHLKSMIGVNPNAPWQEACYDDNNRIKSLKVTSHQTNSDGSSRNKFTQPMPCKFAADANQLSDDGASIGIRTVNNNTIRNMLTKPNNVKWPPGN